MKKLLLLLFFAVSSAAAQVKVACVGNSITYGAGIVNREQNSYPSQLQYLLGDGYEVRNFGHNARTLLKKGDLPYVEGDQYAQSIQYKPDVVVIKLGTNDLKARNAVYLRADFYNDYKELVESYRKVNPDVRVILCTPVRCYQPDSVFSSEALREIVIPAVEKLAYDLDCEVVDLYSVFGTEWVESLLPDRLHPSSIGAGMLARKIADVIQNDGKKPVAIKGEDFNFHGYKGENFVLNGVDCKLVVPKKASKDALWVIRARFWDHEPQLDIDLLEHGFAVAYCDVADLYGAPKAVGRWNAFYDYMTGLGFNKKVVLEGMSRGGLIVYNWAAENPQKVACIYADAPVMDLMSWPVGAGAKEDVEKMLKAYGFKDLEQVRTWNKQPVDQAPKLVGIPIIHVVGDVDEVVPVADNTAVFEQRFRRAGGEMTVIHKPGVGHHPHSLAAPKELTDFILKACGVYSNPCTAAVPGNEYRSLSAGWTQDADWYAQAAEIAQLLQKQTDIVLLGNSITQGFGGERTLVAGKAGKPIADSVFAGRTWVAAGISGDKTQNLLWRLRNGHYGNAHPKQVFITIGINNLHPGDDPKEVAEGVIAVAQQAEKEFGDAQIVLFGVLPAGLEKDDNLRKRCDKLHEILARTEFQRVRYVNPTPWFVDADGRLKTELYASDHLHLTAPGYRVWCEGMATLIK